MIPSSLNSLFPLQDDLLDPTLDSSTLMNPMVMSGVDGKRDDKNDDESIGKINGGKSRRMSNLTSLNDDWLPLDICIVFPPSLEGEDGIDNTILSVNNLKC